MAKYYIIDGLNVQVGPQFNISTNVGEIKGAIRDIEDVVGSNGNLDDVISKTGVDLGFGAALMSLTGVFSILFSIMYASIFVINT